MGARAGFAPRRPPCALPPTSGPSRPAASWHQWPPRSARPPVRLSGSSRPSAMSSPATGPIVPIRANRTVSTDTHGRSSDQHHDDDLHKRCMTECSRSLSSWSCPPAARRARPGLDGWLGGTGGGAGISAVRPNRPPAWLAVRLARPLPPPSGPARMAACLPAASGTEPSISSRVFGERRRCSLAAACRFRWWPSWCSASRSNAARC